MVLVDSGADSGSLCSADASVGLVELDGGSAHSGEGFAEERAKEHIGMSGVDRIHLQPHRLRDLNAIHERENDSFLCGAHEVGFIVDVEVDSEDGASGLLVLKNAFSAVAEGDDADSFRADGH